MTDEPNKYYFLLGLKPGASPAELKAAHRDLAKVWHPDRFLHDPHLRQKAEQKLKEINEAYDQLRSGNAKQQTPPPRHARHATVKVASRRRIRWQLILAPMLIFAAAFLVASRSLLQTGERVEESSIPAIKEVQHAPESAPTGSAKDAPAKDRVETKSQKDDFSGATSTEPNAALMRPLPTVTVVIDPVTGMLAKPGCPTKTSMTYPKGNEPHAYCTSHRAQPIPPLEKINSTKDSRVQSAAKRLTAPVKWLDEKTK